MFSQIFILPKPEVKPVFVIDTTKLPVPATLSTDPVAETPEGVAVVAPIATSDPTEEAQDEESDISLDEMKDQEGTISDETENQE